MRIGILTYHRTHNYGAVLQAIATRLFLQKRGHEVHYVDYWPEYHSSMYRVFDIFSFRSAGIKGKIKLLKEFFIFYRKREKRIKAFKKFLENYINPYCLPYNEKETYDAIIYGSDQIWRKQARLHNNFNPVYFGDNVIKAKRHISYAASMGIIDINDNDKKNIYSLLCKFHALSVRETELKTALEDCGLNNISLVLDPTLLISKDEWEKEIKPKRLVKEKYVLFYDLLTGSFDKSAVYDYAKQKNCRVINLRGKITRGDDSDFTLGAPDTFLSLIKYAECTFTSSYHGLVFSIIFNTPFYVSFKKNAGRAETLLDNLGLKDRLLKPGERNIKLDEETIDFESINSKLKTLKDNSITYLTKALDGTTK